MSSNFSQVRFKLALPRQFPAQTGLSFQAKRIVINFRLYNVDLSGCLIFEPVPYLHHSTVSFPDPDHNGLRPKINLLIPEPVLPFFPDRRGRV